MSAAFESDRSVLKTSGCRQILGQQPHVVSPALRDGLPAGHLVLWTAVGMDSILVPDDVRQGEVVAFRPSSGAIEFKGQCDAEFAVGSAPTPRIQAPQPCVPPRRGSRRFRRT